MIAYLSLLQTTFSDRLLVNEPLARYTSARVGGPADALLFADSRQDLINMITFLVQHELPYIVLGGGSNVLVSDAGLRCVVVINRARRIKFNEEGDPPTVWAESGASLGLVARQAAVRGLSGLEWACGIPGTVGGAVIGNAGAHGADMASNLLVAEILHLNPQAVAIQPQQSTAMKGDELPKGLPVEEWSAQQCEFSYRTSAFKREAVKAVILSAKLALQRSTPQAVQEKMEAFTAYRRRTQPPGASVGSMFKNPPGDYAGRLIEAAGLKGTVIGGAQISPLHANFFINQGNATASDILALIELARRTVGEKTGVQLELEIQLLGDYES